MPCRWLLDGLSEAYGDAVREHDWLILRPLYRDDALIAAVARPGEYLTPDDFLAELSAHPGYLLAGPRTVIPFDEHAGAIQARMRLPTPSGSYQTVDRTLLFTFVDDLIYRQVNTDSVDHAAAIYAEHGTDLAMSHDRALPVRSRTEGRRG